MEITKIAINAEKEFDSLRQEMSKCIEHQQKLLALKVTIIAAFLGLGLNNNNNSLILMVPIIVAFFAFLWKNFSYSQQKIAYYIRKRYEHEGGPNWETYCFNNNFETGITFTKIILGFGNLGLFLLWSILAIAIGLVKYKGTGTEQILLFFDLLALAIIILLFYVFNGIRLKKTFERSGDLIN